MKPVTLIGIALIIVGVLALAYQGITYTTREKVIDLGPLKASVEKEKTIPLPPILGALALAGVVVLVVVGALESRKSGGRRGRPAVTRNHTIAHEIKRGADMSLIGVILTLVVVGVLLWLVNNYVPMDSKIKTILNVVVVVVVVIWLLQSFGVLGSLRDVRIR